MRTRIGLSTVLLSVAFMLSSAPSKAVPPTPAQVDASRIAAIASLAAEQQGDGSYRNGEGTSVRLSGTVADAYLNAGLGGGFLPDSTLLFLQGAQAGSVDALARQHVALQLAGRSTTALSARLNSMRNSGFAWGAYDAYDSSIPDTPLAALALLDTGVFDLANASKTLCNGLLFAQRPDGSFSYTVNGFDIPASQASGAVIPTAYAAQAIHRLRLATGFVSLSCQRLENNAFVSTPFNLVTVVSDAITWLLAQQNPSDGGFGTGAISSVLETAVAYRSLAGIDAVTYQTQLGEALGYLVAQQQPDGSWNGDPFATALALRTLPTLAPGTLSDTDGDGLPDDVESVLGTNPLVADREINPGNGIGAAGIEFSVVLTAGTRLVPYSVMLDSFAGTPSFTWSIESGFVPDGLVLNPSTGELSGVPSTPGLFNFAYRVEDSQAESQRVSAQIEIVAGPAAVPALPAAAQPLLALLIGAMALPAMRRLRRLRWTTMAALLVAGGAVAPAAEAQADPAPVPDAVVERLLSRQSRGPDPLVQEMQDEIAATRRILSELPAGPGPAGSTGPVRTPEMLLASKVAQMDVFADELARRFAASRQRLAALGLDGHVARLDELEGRVSKRISGLSSALNAVLAARGRNERVEARRAALEQLQQLSGEREASDLVLRTMRPTLRSDEAQPAQQLEPSRKLPGYLSGPVKVDLRGREAPILATAAAPPPLPAGSASCGTPAELASALAETEEVQLTPEIMDLAESLDYSPARIFEHVYHNVAFEPYYGSLKGAVGTLVAGSGGATDQASLLIALLRASNVPARYVKGQVLVDDAVSDPQGSRIAKWLGTRSYSGASARLQQGQNPQVFILNNASAQPIGVSLIHVWVEACVPYGNYRGSGQDDSDFRWIPLDASFKDVEYQAGIDTSVAFDYSTYLAQRTLTLPDEFYRGQVLNAVRMPGVPPFDDQNTLSDVPYTGSLQPFAMDVLPASLPFKVVQFLDWDGLASPEADEVPDSHRHKLTIRVRDNLATQLIDTTVSLPEVGLARLTLGFEGATPADQTALQAWQTDGTLPSASPTPLPCVVNVVPVLRGLVAGVEGQVLASGPSGNPLGVCSSDHQLDMEVSVGELLNPVLNSITFTDIDAATLNALQTYVFQTSDRLLSERATRLLETVRTTADPNTNLDETEGEFLNLVGLKYMRADADGSKRIAELRNGSGDRGPSLGRTAAQAKVDYVFDIPFAVARNGYFIDIPGGRSRNVELTTGELDWPTFLLNGYHGSALEHHVWQENIRLDAVSTVRGLQFAHENGIASFTADSSNWATVTGGFTTNPGCTIDATLNWPQCILDSIEANYIANGFTVTLPESLIQYGDWKGYVFLGEFDGTGSGVLSQAAFIIGKISGGYTLRPIGDPGIDGVPQTTYDPVDDTGYVTPDPDAQYAVTPPPGEPVQPLVTNPGPLSNGIDRRYTAMSKGVNVATGNFGNEEVDIDIPGRGELPLVFKRFYNSRNPVDGPLGFGWTHNFDQRLSFGDNNVDDASDAGDSDGLTSSVRWSNSSGGYKLFRVTGGPSGVPIGSTFTPYPGSHAEVMRNPDGTYSVREPNGITFNFETVPGQVGDTARLVSVDDRNGNSLTLTRDASCGDNLCSVTDDANRALTFTYDANDRITQIQDFSGRQFQYQYNDGQGNLTDYLNPLAVAGSQPPVQYEYFQPADGVYLNHSLKRKTDGRGHSTQNEYYANGKLFRITDANGGQRTFRYNDFRRESVEVTERGFTKTFLFDPYGNTTRIIKENGAEVTQVFDIGNPDRIYDKIAVISPEGLQTQYSYDAVGNLTSLTRPSGSIATFSHYNDTGQPGKLIDANGNAIVMRYDASGNLLAQLTLTSEYCTSNDCAALDPASYVPAAGDMVEWSVFAYDGVGNNTGFKQGRDFAGQVADDTVTSETGPRLVYTYDVNGLYPTAVSRTGRFNDDAGVTTQSAPLGYDVLGRLIVGIDDHWYPTSFSYDTLGRVLGGTDDLGVQRMYSYDAVGNRTGERILDGVRVAFSQSAGFDALNRQISRTDTGGNVTRYAYDEVGNLVRATDPDGGVQRFVYDAVGFPIRYYDALGNVSTRSYDESGRPRSATDANGNTTSFEFYDASGDGRVESFTNRGNRKTRFVYDANGNAVETTLTGSDAVTTRTTKRFFDELNRPERVVGPVVNDPVLGALRRVAVMAYDPLGNVVSVQAGYTPDLTGDDALQDVLSPRSASQFDDFGRRIEESDGLGRTWAYQYDPHDHLVQQVDPKGQATSLSWQRGDLLLNRTADDGSSFDYQHNLLGQVTRVVGPEVTYRYEYDASLRLRRMTDSRGGKRLDYLYSPAGRLNRLSDSDGNVIDYFYDAKGNLTGVWAPNFDFVGFSYDAGGRLTGRHLANGASAEYDYNPDGSVQEIRNRFGGATISQHSYGYDVLGNRNSHAETIGGTTTNYAYQYDELNRLIQTDNGNPAELESYTYDVFGNRTSLTKGGSTTAYLYDAGDQLTESRDGTVSGPLLASFTYDANGNLTGRSDTGAVYTYDALDRLVQVSQPPAPTQAYAYDGQGRRIRKEVGGVGQNFVYDGLDQLSAYDPAWNAPTEFITYGPIIDQPLIRESGGSSEYFYQDGLNSVVAKTDGLGAVIGTQRFDAWGQELSSTGNPGDVGYTGRIEDATGLVYYRSRYYDPTTGRFAQRDSLGLAAGLNPYAYADNNPVLFNDPTGNCPACAGALVGAVAGVLFQAGADLISGERSSFAEYVGAAAGGAAGGAAALTCGPACAGAAAGAAASAVTQGIQAFNGDVDFSTADGVLEGVTNLAIDTAVGAATGGLLEKLTPAMKSQVSTQLKGDIGEALTNLRILLTGKIPTSQVPNGVGKSTFDFAIGDPALRNFIEAKFGTAGLSAMQKLAAQIPGTNLTVDRWTYEIFWGIVAAGPAGALSGELDLDTLLSLLGGGYTIGDVFAPVR